MEVPLDFNFGGKGQKQPTSNKLGNGFHHWMFIDFSQMQ